MQYFGVCICISTSGVNNGHCYAGQGECLTFTLKEIAVFPQHYSCGEDVVIKLHQPYDLAVRIEVICRHTANDNYTTRNNSKR